MRVLPTSQRRSYTSVQFDADGFTSGVRTVRSSDAVTFQNIERHDIERAFMRGLEVHLGRATLVMGLQESGLHTSTMGRRD